MHYKIRLSIGKCIPRPLLPYLRLASKMEYANPQRKMVMHAYDSLASGQVTSNEQVFDIENSITEAIEELKTAISGKDEEKVEMLCKRIEELSDERKSKLTARRPF